MTLRCLIVDDEPPARQLIKEFLTAHGDIEIVGECHDGLSAVETIELLKPDLIFLDIQMPELTGFEVLEAIRFKPCIIFSTAFDKYAVKAFEVSAVDYLLKPYVRSRFDEALNRARQSISSSSHLANLDRLLDAVKSPAVTRPLDRLLVRGNKKIILVRIHEIHWFEAMEDYVQIHTNRANHLVTQTMNYLETRLDQESFVRIHRSYIVNLSAINELRPLENGRMICILINGHELPVSRAGSRRLKELMT
ncbi:response regulator transcription factor [bacterium]|nr:response regulator transcription factor [bacterium]